MESIGQMYGHREWYVTPFVPGCLSELPWPAGEWDCVILNSRLDLSREEMEAVSQEVAKSAAAYIGIAGFHAEQILDVLWEREREDSRRNKRPLRQGSFVASIKDLQGRRIVDELASAAILRLSFNGRDHILAVVLGDEQSVVSFKEEVRRSLEKDAKW
jgi:hypothetical protein